MNQTGKIIRIVAAVVSNELGQTLLVRKRGSRAFMQPGGKRDPGESDLAALAREIGEELGCDMDPSEARHLGDCSAPAANEPGPSSRPAFTPCAFMASPRRRPRSPN